jgi:Tfp pilus assembly pilus retraction ATPase PilT
VPVVTTDVESLKRFLEYECHNDPTVHMLLHMIEYEGKDPVEYLCRMVKALVAQREIAEEEAIKAKAREAPRMVVLPPLEG